MKKTTLLSLFVLFCFSLIAQSDITVRDDAKVGFINTGTGANIQVTQIFGKSPEYAELKKRLDGLKAAIAKKADECEQMAKDSLPQKYREGCRAELIVLNAERDSVQKIETRFREDVIRLAETFSRIELNSRRLFLADSLFNEGKIREAETLLNYKEITREGDALLAKKEYAQQTLQEIDSLLYIKADELALKARMKATDYSDPLRYDSAALYFEQSHRYAESINNLRDFAELLYYDNQILRAVEYLEKGLHLAQSKDEMAMAYFNLGTVYIFIPEKTSKAEQMLLQALEIYENLAKTNPEQYESNLAQTCMNLGNFSSETNQKIKRGENMYLRALEIYERLAKISPDEYEPDLALICMNLSTFYVKTNHLNEQVEKMLLRSLEIYERLVASNPARFEPSLATTFMNLGGFYYKNQNNMTKSEKLYLSSLEIYERLAASNPARFEPDLARTFMNLGTVYYMNHEMAKSGGMLLHSLEIYERLAEGNPIQFEPDLAMTLNNFAYFKQLNSQFGESKKMYSRGLAIYQKSVTNGQGHLFENLMLVFNNMASLRDSFASRGDAASAVSIQIERAECMYSLKEKGIDYKLEAVSAYDELYQTCFYAKMYKEAAEAAERVLDLAPSRNWVRPYLGHSHLLHGDWGKAKQAYEQYIANEQDPAEAKTTLLKDWDDLEKAGITHKDMEKARQWVKE